MATQQTSGQKQASNGVQDGAAGLDISEMGRAWWAKRKGIGAFTGACTLLALAVCLVLTPRYEAGMRLLMEPAVSLIDPPETLQQSATRERVVLDQEAVASQVELMRSRDVALAVIDELNLTDRLEFTGQGPLDSLLSLIGLGPDEQSLLGETVDSYKDRLRAFHVPDTRVIGLTFWSHDPELAAAGADAVARAFLDAQVQDRREVSRAATDYLGQEIARMRARVAEAERAVQDFRARAGLMEGANDVTLPAQKLSELNTQLTRARSLRIDAEGRAQQIRRALATDAAQGLGTTNDNPFIQTLLQRQGAVQGDLADASTTLGPSHPRIRQLQAQLRDINAQIAREARRVAGALDDEARTAQARERALEAELDGLQAEAADAGLQDVELRALEREAKAQRDLLETLLGRYRQASASQDPGAQPADARIISSASVPLEPSFPKVGPTVLVAFLASLLIASGVVLSNAVMAPLAAAATRPRRTAEPHWPDEAPAPSNAAPSLGATLATAPSPQPAAPTPTAAPAPSATSKPSAADRLHALAASRAAASVTPHAPFAADPPSPAELQTGEEQGASVSGAQRPGAWPAAASVEPVVSRAAPIAPNLRSVPAGSRRDDTSEARQPSGYRDPEPDTIATPDGLAAFAASLGAPVRVLLLSPGATVAGLAAVVLADAFSRGVTRTNGAVLAVDTRIPGDDALEALVGLDRAAGLTELLAGEVELEDVLHRLSGCGAHVISAGDMRRADDLDGADAVLDALGESYDALLVLADAESLDRLPVEAFDHALLFTDGLSGDDVAAWMDGLAARGLPDVSMMTAETATGSQAA